LNSGGGGVFSRFGVIVMEVWGTGGFVSVCSWRGRGGHTAYLLGETWLPEILPQQRRLDEFNCFWTVSQNLVPRGVLFVIFFLGFQ
jgi:hypothetical protein